MTYLSIIEKFNILFDTMMDFYFIIVFSVLLMIFTFLYIAKKITVKRYSLFMLLSFIGVFGISIISNYEVLYNTFDNFTTIFFGNIYFPSIYVYIGILIIGFISFLISIFNVMINKIYKVINSIIFVLNNVLFVVILNIIAKNNIDIFSVQSLYSNTSLVAVLELSTGLFIIWVLSIVVVYTTNIICINLNSKKVKNKETREEVFSPIVELTNDVNFDVNSLSDEEAEPIYVEAIVETELKEEKPIELVQDDTTKETNIEINKNENYNVTFNDILNGTIPVTYYDNNSINNLYDLVDPQNVYEDNYNKVKVESTFNDILIETDELEELTKIDQEKVSEESNILLNDLTIEKTDNNDGESYSVDDYKKLVKMLSEIKNHSSSTNINVDDAVAIGLIKNYSIDDCIKFKNILENDLN